MDSIIFYCNNAQVSAIANKLNYIYTQNRLEHIMTQDILPMVRRQSVVVEQVDADGPIHMELGKWLKANLRRNTGFSKSTMMAIMALILSDKRNFSTWMSQLPTGTQQLWSQVLNNLTINYKDADRLTGNESAQDNRRYFSSYSIKSKVSVLYPWFDTFTVHSFDGFDIYLALNREIYSLVAPMMMQFSLDDCFVTDRVERVIFNAEAESLYNVPAIQSLYAQGVLSIGKTKLVMKTAINKLAGMNMTPLPMPDRIEEPNLREQAMGLFVASAARHHLSSKDKSLDVAPPILIKIMADELKHAQSDLFSVASCFLDGTRYTEQCGTTIQWLLWLLEKILTLDADEWMDVDALFPLGALLLGKNIYALWACGTPDDFRTMKNRYTGVQITIANMAREVGVSMLRGLIAVLASVGLVELATVDGRHTPASTPFDAFDAFRLTALGRYVYGIDDVYEAQEAGSTDIEPDFEASATHLIVRALKPSSPYVQILRTMATDVGNNRWSFTSKSFLTGCSTLNDVNRQIDLFKQYICSEPTQVWLDFFDALKQQVQPLKPESLVHYRMYSVDPSNRQLLQLLDSDQRLRQFILRVDGYRLLISNNNYLRFTARLKELGYLV